MPIRIEERILRLAAHQEFRIADVFQKFLDVLAQLFSPTTSHVVRQVGEIGFRQKLFQAASIHLDRREILGERRRRIAFLIGDFLAQCRPHVRPPHGPHRVKTREEV